MTEDFKEIYVMLHGESYVIKVAKEHELKLKRVLEKRPNLTEFEDECFDKKLKYTMERI